MLKKIITIILTLSGTLVFGLPENIEAGIPESAEGNLTENEGFKKYDYPFNIKVPEKVKEMAIMGLVDESIYYSTLYTHRLQDKKKLDKKIDSVKNRITRFYGMKVYQFKYTPKKLNKSTPVKDFITWRDSSYLIFIGLEDKKLRCFGVETYKGNPFPLKPSDGFAAKLKEEMEKVLEEWPVSEGYHPILIAFPRYTDGGWYFHVPEKDDSNLTPLIESAILEPVEKKQPPRKKSREYHKLSYIKGFLNTVDTKDYLKSYERLRKILKERAEKIEMGRNNEKN